MIRYRDGKIVSTKGERFTQVTKAESEEMKKSYVNIPNYDCGYIWHWLDNCNIYFLTNFIMLNIIARAKNTVAVISKILTFMSFIKISYFGYRNICTLSQKKLLSYFCNCQKYQVLWRHVDHLKHTTSC